LIRQPFAPLLHPLADCRRSGSRTAARYSCLEKTALGSQDCFFPGCLLGSFSKFGFIGPLKPSLQSGGFFYGWPLRSSRPSRTTRRLTSAANGPFPRAAGARRRSWPHGRPR
jgi:hypothetical protein